MILCHLEMYLLEILILSSDSKEVIYIRRPCVWICTICMFLLVWFHATHMQEQWQKNYPYEALLAKNNDKINAYVKGIYYRTEPTDSSNRLYLKKYLSIFPDRKYIIFPI